MKDQDETEFRAIVKMSSIEFQSIAAFNYENHCNLQSYYACTAYILQPFQFIDGVYCLWLVITIYSLKVINSNYVHNSKDIDLIYKLNKFVHKQMAQTLGKEG